MLIQWFGHFDLEPHEVMDRLIGGGAANPALPAGLVIDADGLSASFAERDEHMLISGGLVVEPDEDGGSLLIVEFDVRFRGVMRLAGLLQRGRMRRIVHGGFNRMQTDIEAELAGAAWSGLEIEGVTVDGRPDPGQPVQRWEIPSGQA